MFLSSQFLCFLLLLLWWAEAVFSCRLFIDDRYICIHIIFHVPQIIMNCTINSAIAQQFYTIPIQNPTLECSLFCRFVIICMASLLFHESVQNSESHYDINQENHNCRKNQCHLFSIEQRDVSMFGVMVLGASMSHHRGNVHKIAVCFFFAVADMLYHFIVILLRKHPATYPVANIWTFVNFLFDDLRYIECFLIQKLKKLMENLKKKHTEEKWRVFLGAIEIVDISSFSIILLHWLGSSAFALFPIEIIPKL